MAVPQNVTLVAGTEQEILAHNRHRRFALICNDSADVVYICLADKPAVVNEGIRLNALGGSYEIGSTNMYRGAVHAVSAAGGVVTVTEVDEGASV